MKQILIILTVVAIVSGCQQAGEIQRQLSFINSLVGQYGGQWNGSALSDCYELEIKNSKTITPSSDSIEYYATLIGREFIDSLNYNFPCLKLEIINEKSIGIASKSSSIEATFDLNLIRRFKDKEINEFLAIRKAYYATKNAYQGKIKEAEDWLNEIKEPNLSNPFVILAKAEILKAENKTEDSKQLVLSISKSNPNEPELHKYISFYYSDLGELVNALDHIQIANQINKHNVEYIYNLAIVHQKLQNWDSSYYYTTKFINEDSTNINAYYRRAYSAFKLGLLDKGCDDLAKVYKLDNTMVFPDSMSNYCNY